MRSPTSRRRRKAIRKLDRQTASRVLVAIGDLADDPRPPGCVQLSGGDGELGIRIGTYRIVYEIRDRALTVLVLRVGHRWELYR